MAWAFVSAAHTDSLTGTSCAVNVPAGVADNDLLICVINGISAVPTAHGSWTTRGTGQETSTNVLCQTRLASSEPASYTWTVPSGRNGGSIFAFRGGFNTADYFDAISSVLYNTTDTTCRAASFTVAAANSNLVFLGNYFKSSTSSFTPPTNPGTFTEHADTWSNDSRFGRCAASLVWTGSGSTGDIDATLADSIFDKYAFCLSIKPASASVPIPRFMRHYQSMVP